MILKQKKEKIEWVKEETEREFLKYLETKQHTKNVQDIAKAILIGKCVAINAQINLKKEISQVNIIPQGTRRRTN